MPIIIEKCRAILSDWFKKNTGNILNLIHPQSLDEKIQWLKLYDSVPIKTQLADKYLVRAWIKEKIGEQYLIPLLGVYDHVEDIQFETLPNQFVIKCNHGSGYNIIVKNKNEIDLNIIKAKLNAWLNTNYAFRHAFELHYRDIQPKVIIESYLDEINVSLRDYRFFCFNGRVERIWLDIGVGSKDRKRNIYDRDWNLLDITVIWPRIETEVPQPDNLGKMVEIAEKLAEGFSFVRVDLYRMEDGTIYFGEMTFSSASGNHRMPPEEDKALGELLHLPELAYDIDSGVYYKERELRFYRNQLSYDFEKIIEGKLGTFGEQLVHQVKENGEIITKQLVHTTGATQADLLNQHRSILTQEIRTIFKNELDIYVRQIKQDVENIVDSRMSFHTNLLSEKFQKDYAGLEDNLKEVRKTLQEVLHNVRQAISNSTNELIKQNERYHSLHEENLVQNCNALQRKIKNTHEMGLKIYRDISQYDHYRRQYGWYKILRFITFGKRRRYYEHKIADLKQRIEEIKHFIN